MSRAVLLAARVDLADALELITTAERLDRLGLERTASDARAFARCFFARRWSRLADAELA